MRLRFNTHVEIFAGSGTTTPGASRGVFHCRLIFEDGIKTLGPAFAEPDIPYYLTIDDYRPKGGFVFPLVTLDLTHADLVSHPPGTPPKWVVIYTDIIVWKDHKNYYRAYLVALPIPVGFPPGVTGGGLLLGGAAIVTPAGAFVGGGGLLLGGAATVVPGGAFVGGGGLLLGGAATVSSSGPAFESGIITFVEGPGGFNGYTTNVITTASPQSVVTGSTVVVAGVSTHPALNGTWIVTRFDSTHLSLNGAMSAGGGPSAESSATWTQTA